jgi:hypothetical protein
LKNQHVTKCKAGSQDWTDFFVKENKKTGNLARIRRKEANTVTRRKNLEKRDNVQELGVDGKIILK